MLKSILARLMQALPAGSRQTLKKLYEYKPGFGQRHYYGQFGEDAFLQAYFRHKYHLTSSEELMKSKYLRGEPHSGFYVDVGANSPVYRSNTYWFYKQGWRGVNIDGAPGTMQLFQSRRPDDINLEYLVSDVETNLTFYYWKTPFEVNTLSQEHANRHARLTGKKPMELSLRSHRLDSILDEYLPPDINIDFMSVDVEEHDLNVIRSNNWERYRPELLLVEDFSLLQKGTFDSEISLFMRSVDYELYAWLRPTAIFRPIGLPDWHHLEPTQSSQSNDNTSDW